MARFPAWALLLRSAVAFGWWLSVAGTAAHAQSLSLNLGSGGSESLATNILGMVALTTVLSLAPGILIMGTSFTRIVIVLSMLRTALGLQQTPPNTVIVSLSLFLTAFIMAPAFQATYDDALRPLMDGSITEMQAFDRGIKPFRDFMEVNASDKDLVLFMDLASPKPQAAVSGDAVRPQRQGEQIVPAAKAAPAARPGTVSRAERDEIPLRVLCPAFLISEMSKAFQIGFLLFLPFLVIDIAVSAVLMGMGMMMLPPVVVSLPFKLIFFVLVDGWELVAGSMVRSFSG
jgi:flagellar biosynthetic protein FliP